MCVVYLITITVILINILYFRKMYSALLSTKMKTENIFV
jgi:hypothetical protein